MGKTFRNIVLASTGDFGDKTDKIKNWVEHAGGKFAKEVSKDVTHLVASHRAWKRYHPMVREARRLRSIHIVKLDWLEDSLTSKSRRPLETAKYAFEQRKIKIQKVRRRRKRQGAEVDDEQAAEEDDGNQNQVEMVTQNHIDRKEDVQRENKRLKTAATKTSTAKKAKQEKKTGTTDTEDWDLSKDARVEISAREFENECAEFQKEMGEIGYRPFTDGNGFTFLITLVRKDILKNRLEKHRLKVRYAPFFAAQPSTFYRICNQEPEVDPRCAVSEELGSTRSCSSQSLGTGTGTTREYSSCPSQGPNMGTGAGTHMSMDTSISTHMPMGKSCSSLAGAKCSCPGPGPDMEVYMSTGGAAVGTHMSTGAAAVLPLRPTLPPCPVLLYFFPKPYPYSQAPVVATSLPRHLQPSNPALRVHIPNPWAQSLQLFEYDPHAALNATTTFLDENEPPPPPPAGKSYACYTVYTRGDQRYVSTLAPPGSTFDFAFAMFSKFFQKRVGVDWDGRQNAGDKHERNMCGDGADDAGFFDFFGPVRVKQSTQTTAMVDSADTDMVDSVEAKHRRPSVTVVANSTDAVHDHQVDVEAMAPEGGW